MRVISDHFGQGGAKLTDQNEAGLKNVLKELQGLRVSRAVGANAGSSSLTDGSATVTAKDTLLAAVYIMDGSGGGFTIESDVCNLVAGSVNNISMSADLSGGDLLVFWFDQDNTSSRQ